MPPLQSHVRVCSKSLLGVASRVSSSSLQWAHRACQGTLLTLCERLKACLRMSFPCQCTSDGLHSVLQPLHGPSVLPRGGCRATKAVY